MAIQQNTTKLIEEIIEQDTITEKQINLIKNRINQNKCEPCLLYGTVELNLELEQTKKGLNWLKNHAFTKSGTIRKNCVLGYRELSIIENCESIKFAGFCIYSINYYYIPIYQVISGSDFFEYYLKAGEPVIIA